MICDEQKLTDVGNGTGTDVVAEILTNWSMSQPDEIRSAVQLLEAIGELDTDEMKMLIATGHAIADRKSSAAPPAKKRGRPKKAE